MKSIDKTTKKPKESYQVGDILKCWNDTCPAGDYELYQVSKNSGSSTFYAVMIHEWAGGGDDGWCVEFGSLDDLTRAIDTFDHVEKVNAHIVLEDW